MANQVNIKTNLKSNVPSSVLNYDIDSLKKKSKEELIQLLVSQSIFSQSDIQIPISLFCNIVPPLESLVKYLKEEKNLSIKEIAKKLNRNIQTIFTTYRNARNKKINFSYGFSVPLSIFSKEKYSILESLVGYLKEICNKKTSEIAKLLDRDVRVIHVHYTRYKLKQLKKIQNKTKENQNQKNWRE
ncbi:MAG: hypothetical protein QW757_03595 [Candidatus Woesearchaeota archaeon]